MRSLIILGLVATLSTVFCKDHPHLHRRENASPRRYKDTKNKRGIGDYPFSLPYSGSPFQGFQSPAPASTPFIHGLPSYGGYGNIGAGSPISLGSGLFSLPSQSPHSYSSLGSSLGNLGGYSGLEHSLNLGQSSSYNIPSSGLSLGNLLSSTSSNQNVYSSPSLGLLSTSDKNGPVTFSPQNPSIRQLQQSYTPMYASSSPVGSSSYSSPVVSNSYSSPITLGSSQIPNYQSYGISSSGLSSMNTHGIPITSLTSGNGITYGSQSTSSVSIPTADSTAHAVTGSYMIGGASQPSGSSVSYNIPVSALSSSSSPRYSISIPTSSYSSTSSNSGNSGSSSSYSIQLPIPASPQATSLSSPHAGGYVKYTPVSSEGSTYSSDPQRTYGSAMKLAMVSYTSPNSYRSTPSISSSYSSLSGVNYAAAPSFSSDNSEASSSKQSSIPLTSYGTPAMSYSIPSTSYGTPSSSQYISNSNYKSPNPGHTTSSANYASTDAPSYSHPVNSYGMITNIPYQADSAYKNSGSNYESSTMSYSGLSSYESQNSGPPNDENSVSSYRNPSTDSMSSLSNSIESHTSSASSNSYSNGADMSSSYSNLSPRYLRYPAGRTYMPYSDVSDSTSSSGYDTISYSVPSGKY